MLTVKDIKGKRLTREDFVFFWKQTGSTEACFSQWYPCPFVVDGVSYNCAEQYMMARKAFVFGDEKAREKIMASFSPMAIKKLGRGVRNFNPYVWNVNKDEIVKKANIAKFSQNQKLKDILLSTGDKILVEASPYDRIWGIGLAEDSPSAILPDKWCGENRLGFILMEVRKILRDGIKEEKKEDDDSLEGALMMWSLGAGNSARRFNSEDPMPEKRVKATADSWTTLPLEKFVTIPQDYYLTEEQMNVISMGHIPDAMEDHWFMYCDDTAIRYYRGWTGVCFAEAFFEKTKEGYRIYELRINNNPEEHRMTNPDADVALFYALLISEYGGPTDAYWKAALGSVP